MRRPFAELLGVCVLGAAGFALAADKPASDEFVIGLSPEAAKNSERTTKLDLYRRAVMGDLSAKEGIQALPAAQRTSLMAELAMTPDAKIPRADLIKKLGKMSRSDDPEGTGLVGLARVAVAEGDGSLRRMAQRALTARNDERTPKLLASALKHEDDLIRGNAREALRAFGGPRVFEIVIEHWKEVWGAGPRTHAFFGTQRSYVADYDISGDTYDPVIRTYFTGTVIDTKVLRVEADVYLVTIREIAGIAEGIGNAPPAWEKWLAENRSRLLTEAEKNRNRSISMLYDTDDE
jgi:hypothetical protein